MPVIMIVLFMVMMMFMLVMIMVMIMFLVIVMVVVIMFLMVMMVVSVLIHTFFFLAVDGHDHVGAFDAAFCDLLAGNSHSFKNVIIEF